MQPVLGTGSSPGPFDGLMGGLSIPVKPILIGDIGGTNARFALLADAGIGPIERLRTAGHPTPEAAIDRFLAAHGRRAAVGGMALAVARPFHNVRSAPPHTPVTP